MSGLVFLFSFLVAAAITPLVIRLYTSRGWIDDPHQHKHVKVTHHRPVPRGGGLVIMAAILVSSLVFLDIDKYLVGILAASLLLAGVGFLDDILDLNPVVRLITGAIASLIVVAVGIGIAYVTNPFGPGVIHLNQPQVAVFFWGKLRTIWVLADLFAMIFIIWNMNIVNWSKGVDGQLPGFVAIGAVVIGLLSSKFAGDPTTFNTAHLSFIVAGAFTGLLVWNFYPQKIMPGYGAGSLAGFYLAVLAILSGAKVATALMILAIPTADAVFTILRRLRAKKLPIWGDRGHLHHKLMDVLGWGRRRVAVFYWLSSLALGLLSLYLNTWGKIITIGLVTALVFGFLIWAKFKTLKKYEPH